MPKLGDVIKSLAEKAGRKADDDILKKLLALPEMSAFELPDDFANDLEQKLLTEASAAANPIVRSKIFAEALNGVDSELDKIVDDFGFDDTFKTGYKTIQKNTNEKVRKIKEGLKAQLDEAKKVASKSGDPNDKAKVTALENQIKELNTNMESLKRMHQTELDNMKIASLNDKKQFTLRSVLSGKPLPKNGLAPDVNIEVAESLINKAMAKNNLVYSLDAAGNPVLKEKKDGAEVDYYVNNKPVDFGSFIDGVLAQNKFLQINDPNPQSQGGAGNTHQQIQGSNPSNQGIVQETQLMLEQLGTTV